MEKIEKYSQNNVRILYNSLCVCVCVHRLYLRIIVWSY